MQSSSHNCPIYSNDVFMICGITCTNLAAVVIDKGKGSTPCAAAFMIQLSGKCTAVACWIGLMLVKRFLSTLLK